MPDTEAAPACPISAASLADPAVQRCPYPYYAALHAESLAAIGQAETAAALEQVRIRYLGRNGLLPAVMKQLKEVPAEERPSFGRQANAWRQALEAINAHLDRLQAGEMPLGAPSLLELRSRRWRQRLARVLPAGLARHLA